MTEQEQRHASITGANDMHWPSMDQARAPGQALTCLIVHAHTRHAMALQRGAQVLLCTALQTRNKPQLQTRAPAQALDKPNKLHVESLLLLGTTLS